MSKEYIEREAALEKVIEVKHYDPELNGVVLHRYIKEIDLKDIPATDVVEVVRCIDCRYCISATADNAEYELCIVDNDVFPVSVQKQHFCGRGERKEEA
mgnify:CR=1 FL=1